MATTNPASVEDSPEHIVKLVRELQSTRGYTQQNMWFIIKSLRLLKVFNDGRMLRVNKLLKDGAFTDAALLVRPEGGQIASLVERGDEYHVIMATPTLTESGYGFTPGSAFLTAFAKIYLRQLFPEKGVQ